MPKLFRSPPCLLLCILASSLFLGTARADSQSTPQKPPPERVVPLGEEALPRATDAPNAPKVVEACGTDQVTGFDRPDIEAPYSRETTPFAVQIKDEVIPYRLMSLTVLPETQIDIEAVFAKRNSIFNACAMGGELTRLDQDEWVWWSPEKPGVYSIFITDSTSEFTMQLQMLVMEPYRGEDTFKGYRIGRYEAVPLRNNPKYKSPDGLVKVTQEMENLWLSPHFQLRQFLCKQDSDSLKFALFSTRLLLKLELLLEKVNDAGIAANTFAVLSGYRTPHYNRVIGNSTRYSRHLYGDAADIYIDRNRDGRMDDLDGDGKETRKDAVKLASIIEDGFDSIWYRPFIGGLGIYGPKPHRGPFIHVDTRGFKARW